ncbi:MAG: cytochrome c [Lysobacteraceae bacterium]|nr:MAG: cytochrome c [Xanthomonadaceae bacterium]
MSFRRTLGLAGVLLSSAALAQSESSPATVTAAPEPAAAVVTELTDAHGPAQAGDAAAGEAKAAVCAACHGADGNSSDPQYPKLAGQHERYIARHLALFKNGERNNPIMLGFAATLSPQDMRDLGAYFAGKTIMPGMADDSVVAEGPYAGKKFYQIGERIYRGGDAERGIPACIGCHGPAGRGNPGPAYPAIGGQHAAYTAAQLKAFRDGTVHGKGENANPVMAGVAHALTDEEIGALASYIEGLHAREGTAGGK